MCIQYMYIYLYMHSYMCVLSMDIVIYACVIYTDIKYINMMYVVLKILAYVCAHNGDNL